MKRVKRAHALIKLYKCLISTINVHNDIRDFKQSWRSCNSLCGLPLPYGEKKILCKGLRHSFCNHFNGQMPPGQEVVAEWTNSAGLVLCSGDPASQTNLTLRRRISARTTIHWLHGRGQFCQGIRASSIWAYPAIFWMLSLDFERLV